MKFLSVYQIFGGLLGVALLAGIDYSQLPSGKIVICVIAALLYSACLTSGILLLKGNFKLGIPLAIALNILQVVSFSVLGITFKFVSGLCLGVLIDLTTDVVLGLNFDVSKTMANFSGTSGKLFIGVNFIPLLIIHFLLKPRNSA